MFEDLLKVANNLPQIHQLRPILSAVITLEVNYKQLQHFHSVLHFFYSFPDPLLPHFLLRNWRTGIFIYWFAFFWRNYRRLQLLDFFYRIFVSCQRTVHFTWTRSKFSILLGLFQWADGWYAHFFLFPAWFRLTDLVFSHIQRLHLLYRWGWFWFHRIFLRFA